MKNPIRKAIVAGFIVLALVTTGGCASFKALFSEGYENFTQGQDAINNGDYALGLLNFGKALVQDPGLEVVLEQWHTVYDRGRAQLEADIKTYWPLVEGADKSDAQELANLVSVLKTWNDIGAVLSQVALPVATPETDERAAGWNLGPWEELWPQRSDELVQAQRAAGDSWTALGLDFIENETYEEGIRIINDAMTLYGPHKEQAQIAFDSAGELLRSKALAAEGLATIEGYKEAARIWDLSQSFVGEEYQIAKARISDSIAALLYDRAIAQRMSNNRDAAIAALEELHQWVPEYRDSIQLMYSMRVERTLDPVVAELDGFAGEYDNVHAQLSQLMADIDTSVEGVEVLEALPAMLRSTKDGITSVNGVCKALKAVPVVGNVSGVVSRGLTIIEGPVGTLSHRASQVENVTIAPLGDSLRYVQSHGQTLMEYADRGQAMVAQLQSYLRSFVTKMSQVELNETQYQEVERCASVVANGLSKLKSGTGTAANTVETLTVPTGYMARYLGHLSGLKRGMEAMVPVLDKIRSVTDRINSTLEHKFTVNLVFKKVKFSVRDILDGVSGVTGFITDMAMDLLDPLLDELGVEIPNLPGIDEAMEMVAEIDQVQTLTQEGKALFQECMEYFEVVDEMNEAIRIMDELVAA